MPPIKKYSREDILNVSLKIIEQEGLDNLNARRIAQEMGCSVQPIFHNFDSMEVLIKDAKEKIYKVYKEMMNTDANDKAAYKKMGLSYIRFAEEYPEFFKILFMSSTTLNAKTFIMEDNEQDDIIKKGQLLTGLNYEEQVAMHIKVWIFTHGIACLVATKTIQFGEHEIEELLENTVREMIIGYRSEEK